MIKEIIKATEKKTELSVVNGKIISVLRSDNVKTGIRMYADGAIGIAGAIGAYDEQKLTDKAKHMLNFKLPYQAKPTENIKQNLDFSSELKVTDEEFVQKSRELLELLEERFPKWMFSHKMELLQTGQSLTNANGVDLIQNDRFVKIILAMKFRESKNLFDDFVGYSAREYDINEIIRIVTEKCEAYEQKKGLETEGKIAVVMEAGSGMSAGLKFVTDLRGDVFGSGASLFSGKIGQELFHKDFSLQINRNTKTHCGMTFFDGEGTVLENNQYALIDNGVLKSPYTNKRMAQQFGFDVTGAASLAYNEAPALAMGALSIKRGEKTIKELLGGRPAIYAASAAGGDFTPQGEFSSPVQLAYYFDGEKMQGRLPQLSMMSNVFDMFGKDFIGASSNSVNNGISNGYVAFEMDIKKIGEWM